MPDLQDFLDDPLPLLRSDDAADRRLGVALVGERLDHGRLDDGRLDDGHIVALRDVMTSDPEPVVRAAAIEALGRSGRPDLGPAILAEAQAATDARVVEAAATALGELEWREAVPWLIRLATEPGDTHAREAAVASLGAIGDPSAVPVLLELVRSGPPQVRRRTVVALTVFDDPRIEEAIAAAREDRNPMVREVAEMVMGRRLEE